MQIKFQHFLLAALTGLLFGSCIDEIKLDTGDARQLLVVDGLLSDSLQVHDIRLNYSALLGLGLDHIKEPVTGATVRVLDDAGGSFDFTETASGVYSRLMQGEAGKAYHVELKTADGKTIRSTPAVLTKAPPLLPATTKVVEEVSISQTGTTLYDKRLALEINTDVSAMPERPYLRWRATGEYEFGEDYPGIIDRKICYVKNTVDLNNIKIFDTHTLAGGLLFNEPLLTTKYDYRFAYMYCFHLFQFAISEAEYQYWRDVRDNVTIDGSLFDPPPGTVTGNLFNPDDPNDQILGYFSVAGVHYKRHFISAAELGVSAPPRCRSWSGQPQYSECRDCTEIQNSSVERPWYWKP